MSGQLTTNLDPTRTCTISGSFRCDVNVTWNTSGASSITIQRNGVNWVGPTGSASGTQLHDDPTAGTYTYTLYGNNGVQTLQLHQITVIIYPDSPGNPPPPPPGAPTCSPANQNIPVGGTASFSASGGNGTYTWSAPYGSPTTGSGSNFSTTYSAAGGYQAIVTSASQSTPCNINVSSAAPSDNPPVGAFDPFIDPTNCTIQGWAYDPDTPSTSIDVHVYQGGPYGTGVGVGAYTADAPSNGPGDVNEVFGISGSHRFNISLPSALRDGVARNLYIHAINSAPGGSNPVIGGSPRSVSCTPPTVPPCQETLTWTNTTNGYADYARAGAINTNYWLADPYDAATNASNISRATNHIGISTRAGGNYPINQSRGINLLAPAGGKILSVTFDYQTNAYNPSFARMAIDYPGVAEYWYLNRTGNLDSRPGFQTPGDSTQTVTFPAGGVDWMGLHYFQVTGTGSAPFTFADWYNISMEVARPCNPSVSLTANPMVINAGQATTLTWSVVDANAGSANITPTPGAVLLTSPPGHGGSGTSGTGILNSNTTYTLSAVRWDTGATMSASITVVVNANGSLNFNCSGPNDGPLGAPDAGWDVHTGSYTGPIVASGEAQTSTHPLAAGTYYVTFRSAGAGWTTPVQRIVNVIAGDDTDVNTTCNYTPVQAAIQVNSVRARDLSAISSGWNITGPVGGPTINRNRTGTTFTEGDLLPNQPYTVTASAINSCVAGESFGLPASNPQNVSTQGAGLTVNHNLLYTQGTVSMHSTVAGGSWTVAPNPANPGNCTVNGSGTAVVNYYRAPGSYTITAPNLGAIVPTIRYGGNSYSSPHNITVVPGVTLDITIEYASNPPTAPTNVAWSAATCNTLLVTWLDNSNNETGFRIYYRNTPAGANNLAGSVGPAAGTGTTPSFTWNSPPAGNVWLVVAAYIDYGGGNVVEGASAVTGPATKQDCAPEFAQLSSKVLHQVNGTSYSSSTSIRDGDVLTFRIQIQNNGTDRARINSITDTLSGSLVRPSGGWNLRTDLDANGVYNNTAAENAVTVSGATNPTITINRNKCTTGNHNDCLPSEDPSCFSLAQCNNWWFLIDATVTATVPNIRTEVGNEALVGYTYPVGSGSNNTFLLEAGPYLVQTVRPRVPEFREITP